VLFRSATAQYLRIPFGKTAEDMVDLFSDPAALFKRKESTLVRPLMDIAQNKDGSNRPIWNHDDMPWTATGKAVGHFLAAQIPLDNLKAAANLATGTGDTTDWAKIVGVATGLTTSHGARGGPEAGLEYEVQRERQQRIAEAMPDAMDAFRRAATLEESDPDQSNKLYDQGTDLLRKAGLSELQIGAHIRVARDPRTSRLTPRALRQFYQNATEEEQQRMDAYQRATEAAGVQ